MKAINILVYISSLLLFQSNEILGQSFFYSDTSTVLGFPETPAIGLYDISTCTVSNVSPFSPIRFTDLTVHPNGNLYGFGYNIFNLGEKVMCRITWPPSPSVSIFSLTQYNQDSISALTGGDDGLI